MNDRKDPILYIVIPCYNEQEVLPITAPLFLQKINRKLSEKKKPKRCFGIYKTPEYPEVFSNIIFYRKRKGERDGGFKQY